MLKQILVLSMFMVLVKSQNTDDYINYNREEYAANVKRYDLQMEAFKENNDGQISTIKIQGGMLTDYLLQNDEYLNGLAFLSVTNKGCIAQYRHLIPTSVSVQKALDTCASKATSQLNLLLDGAINTRNLLESYYSKTFDQNIAKCKETNAKDEKEYTKCARSAIDAANTYTINNQKTFAAQMDANGCSADSIIKSALDSSFSVNNSTITSATKANALINGCIHKADCSICF